MAKKKIEIPSELTTLVSSGGESEFDKIISFFGIKTLKSYAFCAEYHSSKMAFIESAGTYINDQYPGESQLYIEQYISMDYSTHTYAKRKWGGSDTHTANLAYIDIDGNCWQSELRLEFKENQEAYTFRIDKYTLGEWTLLTKYPKEIMSQIQSNKELFAIMRRKNPYVEEFWRDLVSKDMVHNVFLAFCCPCLETLKKAGYAFVDDYLEQPTRRRTANIPAFNRLCKTMETNPKKIFKTEKFLYQALKNERDVRKWDIYRKMNKFSRMSKEAIVQSYQAGYNTDDLKMLDEILRIEINGKRVFSYSKLINYLNRLDMYEAIERGEAFILIKDYLHMCKQLDMKPNIEGDSLKREHDVTARLVRERRNAITDDGIKRVASEFEQYNYAEGTFFVRVIRNYDDLLYEARRQHNCVASYGDWISNGNSVIFVARSKNAPDESMITIEIDPSTRKIKQQLGKYNQKITNKSQLSFLKRWRENVLQAG